MKKLVATLLLGIAFVIPMSALGAGIASAQTSCTGAYSSGTCVGPSGQISVTVPGTTAGLFGSGTPGTAFSITQVPLVTSLACSTESAVSFRASGNGLNLTPTAGTLYQFDPATGQSFVVDEVSGAGGTYTLIFGSCAAAFSTTTSTTVLPITGGGHPSSPSLPYLPLAIGSLLVLAGAAVTVRNRVHQV